MIRLTMDLNAYPSTHAGYVMRILTLLRLEEQSFRKEGNVFHMDIESIIDRAGQARPCWCDKLSIHLTELSGEPHKFSRGYGTDRVDFAKKTISLAIDYANAKNVDCSIMMAPHTTRNDISLYTFYWEASAPVREACENAMKYVCSKMGIDGKLTLVRQNSPYAYVPYIDYFQSFIRVPDTHFSP